MSNQTCPQCQRQENRIKQHEKYIAQLVEYVAKINQRMTDLEKRHVKKI
ncbi:hypothetical protein SAMN05421676_101253 [Salinibacillus kushneri]|uniref:Uncharacterized protein n=1 Tax=Salinibacillus kushneri TaxID=237682 RepID=A0A1H9YRE0_9BACI|nr:hypothetical protein [Salinibacillus kushneri]SES71226.1 hypothetical protein SAMN05421676_101253 [Salinibacillus kushneri]